MDSVQLCKGSSGEERIGSTMSLEELFTPTTMDDINQTVNSEILIELARGGKTEVGLKLPHLDSYYIRRSFNRNDQNIVEEELWRSTEVNDEKVILISDSAGMGKSSVLTSLAISIKRDNPHLWLVRVDLSNYTNIMRRALEESRKSISIIELLNSQEPSKLKSDFGKKLFATPKRVVLMLDGVDEVSPTYTQLIINLIRDSLAQVNLAKIFVTARPHVSKDLKDISELQSVTLEPFSKINQKEFLIKYWSKTLNLQDDVSINKCKIFAEVLIEKISVWLNEKKRNNFAGIPLQTRMLAEVFQEDNEINDEGHDWEGFKEFLSSNNEEPKLPTRIDITQLYKLFIDKKCAIYFKKSNPSGHSAADEALKLQLRECQTFHRVLALKVIFDSDKRLQCFTCYTNVEWPIPSTFANNFLFRVGIVQVQEGNIEFLHRTFAEYFVFECLLIELDRKPVNEVLQQLFMGTILIDKEFYVIRAFIDSHMRTRLHLIEGNFSSYFHRNRITERSLAKYFKVFAEEGCVNIFECLIKCIDKEQREILSKTVNELFLMKGALIGALQYCHLNILKLLLELNETFNKGTYSHEEFLNTATVGFIHYYLDIFKFLLHQVDGSGKYILEHSALHEATYEDELNIVRFLLEAGADINFTNDGETALHKAAYEGNLELVKFLAQEAGVDINVKDSGGETALYGAVYWGRLEIVKFLVNEAGADINIINHYGETVLHRAASRDNLEIVKFLVDEAGMDINIKDSNGEVALHKAASWGTIKIVNFLVKEAGAGINVKDNDGETALHKAAHKGGLDIVEFLVGEDGADINAKDNGGETALYNAACEGELDIVKFLVKQVGADINVTNYKSETALHRAVYKGEIEIVKFLVEEIEADINTKDYHGRTALDIAVFIGGLEIVKFLAKEAGADINAKGNDGETALHKAAYGGKLDTVKFLVEEIGANINIKNNNGETALHRAICEDSKLDMVKLLLEAGADIRVKDNDGDTALHKAAYKGEVDMVKFLVEAGADVDAKDNNGVTALCTAVYAGELEIVKFLVEEAGADISVSR